MPCAACFQLNVYPGKNSFSQTVTVNTPPLIVHTWSEDCLLLSLVKKSFNLVAGLEVIRLPVRKGSPNREKNFGFDQSIPSFSI